MASEGDLGEYISNLTARPTTPTNNNLSLTFDAKVTTKNYELIEETFSNDITYPNKQYKILEFSKHGKTKNPSIPCTSTNTITNCPVTEGEMILVWIRQRVGSSETTTPRGTVVVVKSPTED